MDYKISKESVKKYGGYVSLTEEDLLGEAPWTINDLIREAWEKALKEGIKANTVMIDEHFAKVNNFHFVFINDVVRFPPMICGLEVRVSNELPDGYDFAVLETPETEREKLIRQTRADTVKKMQERFSNLLEKEYKQYTPDGADHYFKNGSHMMWSIADRVFNQIAKEILEDKK
jgi:hypothetical protein